MHDERSDDAARGDVALAEPEQPEPEQPARGSSGIDRQVVAGYVVAWLLATTLAVLVGLLAVRIVGANLTGRGPLGEGRGAESLEGEAVADPDAKVVRDTVSGEYGRFVVECQGVIATGIRAVAAPGWQVISYENAPDDDVDAVFSSGRSSVELEVYCNGGAPRLAEQETKVLPRG